MPLLIEKPRLLVVESPVHAEFADALLTGARQAIAAADAEFDVVTAPGPLDIAGVIALAEEGGHRPAGVRYDGYVALGCLVRDETYQFVVAAHETVRALVDLTIGKRLVIGNGVLNVETLDQARERIFAPGGGVGASAARACLQMLGLKRKLLGATR